MNYITENPKNTPVCGSYDVIVCGGGPAGVSAAVTSARGGAKTLLIESEGCLGGIWTTGLLSLIQDGGFKSGFMYEVMERLKKSSGYLHQSSGKSAAYDGTKDWTFDAECMKLILEDFCIESGIDIRLYTRIVDAIMDNERIIAIITESHSGREAFSSKLFIDCTGNGDLAAYSGNSYDSGHPASGKTQPASLLAFISGFPKKYQSTFSRDAKNEFFETFKSAGVEPSYKYATLCRLPNKVISFIMINHEYMVACDSAHDITKATIRARKEINNAIDAIRTIDGWHEVKLVATASHIGLREGRRIHGLYKVCVDDIVKGNRFDDGICLVEYPVDIHGLDASQDATHTEGIMSKPFHIPYRSLVARSVKNLALAGRCVSGDFYAHASYRVTGNAVPMGEAAGLAASIASKADINFHEINGKCIKEELVRRGHKL